MRRREFLQSVGTAACMTVAAKAIAQPPVFPRQPGFGNPLVFIGRGVVSESKRTSTKTPQYSKEPGTLVCLTVTPPQGQAIFATLFVQAAVQGKWNFIGCRPEYTTWYQWTNLLRDIYTVNNQGERVSLFIPDAAHNLPAGVQSPLRYVISFYDLQSNPLPGFPSVSLPPETVTPVADATGYVAFGRGDENPPCEMYDVLAKAPVKLPDKFAR